MFNFQLVTRRGGKRFSLLVLLVLVGVGFAVLRPLAAYAASAQWGIVPSPNPAAFSTLQGVSELAPNNIWAVGGSGIGDSQGDPKSTLVEHFDGTKWSIVPSPNPQKSPLGSPVGTSSLHAVAALASNNVWAVGQASDGATQFTLAEHWDGFSWKIVPSANFVFPGFGVVNSLQSISCTSATDCWAVGTTGQLANGGGQLDVLLEHFDGQTWTAATPAVTVGIENALNTRFATLSSVTAIAPNDVWAAGAYDGLNPADPSIRGTIRHPFTLHWNGATWTIVHMPDPVLGQSTNLNNLFSLQARSANDIVAVGSTQFVNAQGVAGEQPIIERWNGTRWTLISNPNDPSRPAKLLSVAAFAANDIWAVGAVGPTPAIPLFVHWDGHAWSVVSVPGASASNCLLASIATTQGGAAAVGTCGSGTSATTLTELFR